MARNAPGAASPMPTKAKNTANPKKKNSAIVAAPFQEDFLSKEFVAPNDDNHLLETMDDSMEEDMFAMEIELDEFKD